jgi:catechol 2,3-dioxygenase
MTSASASLEMNRPRSCHFGPTTTAFDVMARWCRARRPWELIVVETTADLGVMVGWYAQVLGVTPDGQASEPAGRWVATGLKAAWCTKGEAGHRIAIMELPGLTDDPQRSRHPRLQHVAFALPTIDDLLATYARLKGLGIEPVLTADHGATTAFYYQDPDGNSVELTVDNFCDWEKSSEYMRSSPDFAANTMGSCVDPDEMIAGRAAGISVDELHRRAYAGEFPPAKPMDPRVLL